jgi:hypothetical protein
MKFSSANTLIEKHTFEVKVDYANLPKYFMKFFWAKPLFEKIK